MNKFEFLKILTKNVEHSSSNLYSHLKGTHDILFDLDQPCHVCDAGLFHSVYGTCFFNNERILTREVVRDIIGEEGEELVNTFSSMAERTDHILYTGFSDEELWKNMALIEYANLKEQVERVTCFQVHVAMLEDLLRNKFRVML